MEAAVVYLSLQCIYQIDDFVRRQLVLREFGYVVRIIQ
jgi:hypothetical protein